MLGETIDAIHKAWTRGCAAWPQITLDEGAFRAHVLAALAHAGATEALVPKLCAEDLFVACAALAGDLGAVEVLRRHYIDEVVRRLPADERREEAREEIAQALIFKMLVSDPPKLAEYTGRGPLGRWIRVVAKRMAIDVHRAEARHVAHDGAIASRLVGETPDPELGYIKSKYLGDFQAAFEDALGSLSKEDRLLLRLCTVERMEMGAIAKLHGWHLATAYRRLSAAREILFQETCRLLRERLNLPADELRSLIALVRSQLSASIFSVLGRSAP
jgi:RNA polymerase sigma-70 factor (ECF subfamily)